MIIRTFIETAGTFDEREMLSKFHSGIVAAENIPEEVIIPGVTTHAACIDLSLEYKHCDVAVMLGSWKLKDRSHHQVRSSVASSASCFVVIETPLLGRIVDFQQNKYFRIGVNGFLNNSGIFHLGNCPQDRFDQLGITWAGWNNNNDGHILLMLQLPGDASLRGINIYDWVKYCITKIRKITDRPIVIRTHPAHNIKETDEFYKFIIESMIIGKIQNVTISLGKEKTLDDDLKSAYCCVAYTSGSAIDSILKGIPVLATDPGNFAWPISSNYIENIENLKKADGVEVQQWLNNLAYSQWTIEEMKEGKPWKHLFPIIAPIVDASQSRKKK